MYYNQNNTTIYAADCSMPADYVTNAGTPAIDSNNEGYEFLNESPETTTTTTTGHHHHTELDHHHHHHHHHNYDFAAAIAFGDFVPLEEKIAAVTAPSNNVQDQLTQPIEPIIDDSTALLTPVITQQGEEHLQQGALHFIGTPQQFPINTPAPSDCVPSPYVSPVACWDLSPVFSAGTALSTTLNTPLFPVAATQPDIELLRNALYAGLDDECSNFTKENNLPVFANLAHIDNQGFDQTNTGFVNPQEVMQDPGDMAEKPMESKSQAQQQQQTAVGDPASGSTTPLPPDTPSTATTGTPDNHMASSFGASSAPTVRTAFTTPRTTPVPIRPRPATEEGDRPIKRRKSSSEEEDGDQSASGDKKLYSCPKCSRMFGRKFNMQTHLSTHDPNRIKPFECDHPGCGSKFTRKHDLKRHINGIHKGEKVYECSACQKPFSRKDAWKRHQSNCGK